MPFLKENKNSTSLIVINGPMNNIHNKYIIKKIIDTKTTLNRINGNVFFLRAAQHIWPIFFDSIFFGWWNINLMHSRWINSKNVMIQKISVSVPRDRFERIKYQMNSREVDSKVRFLKINEYIKYLRMLISNFRKMDKDNLWEKKQYFFFQYFYDKVWHAIKKSETPILAFKCIQVRPLLFRIIIRTWLVILTRISS